MRSKQSTIPKSSGRLKGAGAMRQLLSLVLTSGLAITPMALAAEQHGHHSSAEQATAKKAVACSALLW